MATRKRPATAADGPVVGKPDGPSSKFLRVDFKANDFADMIETKTGRLAWARSTLCECAGFSRQTQQPDPLCPNCNGKGFRFFRPQHYVVDTNAIGLLDPIQQKIIEDNKCVVIRGLLMGLQKQPTIYEALGPWAMGSAMLTLRPENLAGYYDRFIQLDDAMSFSEVLVTGADDFMSTRYPCIQINTIIAGTTQYRPDEDYITQDDGRVRWKAGKTPVSGTPCSINYTCHPVWTVMEVSNLIRSSLVLQRVANPFTPEGNHVQLPRRWIVRLEHLPDPPKGDT